METLIVVGCLVGFGLLFGIVVTRVITHRLSRLRTLPVVQPTCATCAHFSLEAGQEELKRNPAFASAATFLQPWRMGRQREFEWDPQYAPLDRALSEAIAAKDQARINEIQRQISELPIEVFGREKKPTTYIPRTVLDLKWNDFGLCRAHEELRARTDKCDRFEEVDA